MPFFVPKNKMDFKLNNIRKLTFCGIIAALYVVLTITPPLNALAYGPFQFRVSEFLCVIPFFAPWAGWGVTVGCLLANIFSTVSAADIIIGTAATLIAVILTPYMKYKLLAPLPTVIFNFIFVGAMLAYFFGADDGYGLVQAFFIYGAEVALGEIAVLYILGVPFMFLMEKTKMTAQLKALSH